MREHSISGVSMYNIYSYNKGTYKYTFLGSLETNERWQAVRAWEKRNPSAAKTVKEGGGNIIVALVDGCGI